MDEAELKARALRDMRAWLVKVFCNLAREFELAAYEVGKR